MRLGLIVDGDSELASISLLKDQIEQRSGNTVVSIVRAAIQPTAPVGVVVRDCKKKLRVLATKRPGRIVVLLDHERMPDCVVSRARQIKTQLLQCAECEVEVVIKVDMFENWVIADLDALQAYPARFQISGGDRRAVETGKADSVNATTFLSKVCSGSYSKVEDAKRIFKKANVGRMAKHSRSFRCFLRACGDFAYTTGSKAANE